MTDRKSRTDEEWREALTPEQYRVCREAGTEAPHTGKYLDVTADGTYLCVCCGSELFRSESKFHSGCGWPSFDDVDDSKVEKRKDMSHGMIRTEVLCKKCGAHLGHLFDDGPTATGLRYCINSVSLDLKEDGE